MKIKINKIKKLYHNKGELKSLITELQLDYNNIEDRFNLITLFIGNLISDNGITEKLNNYYCDDNFFQENFCYQYLNNLIVTIKVILEWKKKRVIYSNIITNLINTNIKCLPNNIDYNLASNFLDNSPEYKKIIGKDVLINFSYQNKILDNPYNYIIPGKIKDFNNPNRFFFIIDSFLIDFSGLSKKQLEIVDKVSKENNWNCWKSNKGPNYYNIVLWNNSNSGFKFKFKENIGNLNLNRDYLTENIKIRKGRDNNKIAYLSYKINQLTPYTNILSSNLDYNKNINIIELLKKRVCTDKIYLYSSNNLDLDIYLKLEIISEKELKHLININKFLYSKEELKYKKDKTGNFDKGFNLIFDKFFPVYSWTWSIFLRPVILGLGIGKDKLSNKEIKISKNPDILPFFLWKLSLISNSEKLIYYRKKNLKDKIINLLETNRINDFYRKLNDTQKTNIIFLKKNLGKLKLLNKTNEYDMFSTKIKCSFLDLSNDLINTNEYNLINSSSYLNGLVQIGDKHKNSDIKKLLFLLVIDYIKQDLSKYKENISSHLEIINYFLNIISTQINLSKNKKLSKNVNFKFNQYFENIKHLYQGIKCS